MRTVPLLLGHKSIKPTEKHYAPFVSAMQKALDEATESLKFDLGSTLVVGTDQNGLGNANLPAGSSPGAS